ncbi:MAG: glycosyltransferase family 9 protein, partial [Limisphaerales bacterium]
RSISEAVSKGTTVTTRDRTGQTNMRELAGELAACDLVVGNDTGGMHLANAVGTPVAVLFGPTNPLVTGPFFDAPRLNCPPEGGSSIQLLEPGTVADQLVEMVQLQTGGFNVD